MSSKLTRSIEFLQTMSHNRMTSCLLAASAFSIALVISFFVDTPKAHARAKVDLPTMSLDGHAHWMTAKSGITESIDTGLMYNYGLNMYAGNSDDVSMHMVGSRRSIDFTLNSTSMSHEELNLLIRYHLGVFYVGAMAGSMQMAFKRADGVELDIFANQYGGNAGIFVNLIRGTYLQVDAKGSIPVDVKEANKLTVTLGTRIEGHALVSFEVLRELFHLQAGFRYETQAATFSGSGAGESASSPFLGHVIER